jgi:hypothetical protein
MFVNCRWNFRLISIFQRLRFWNKNCLTTKRDWQHTQDYWREKDEFPQIDLDGDEFVYHRSERSNIAAE